MYHRHQLATTTTWLGKTLPSKLVLNYGFISINNYVLRDLIILSQTCSKLFLDFGIFMVYHQDQLGTEFGWHLLCVTQPLAMVKSTAENITLYNQWSQYSA